jgi:serine/threonine protein kinase
MMQECDGYGFEVDWWALGALIFESALGRPPFAARNMTNLLRKIAHMPLSFPAQHTLSAPAISIITQLLNKSVADRLGTEGTQEVQDHACAPPTREHLLAACGWLPV